MKEKLINRSCELISCKNHRNSIGKLILKNELEELFNQHGLNLKKMWNDWSYASKLAGWLKKCKIVYIWYQDWIKSESRDECERVLSAFLFNRL